MATDLTNPSAPVAPPPVSVGHLDAETSDQSSGARRAHLLQMLDDVAASVRAGHYVADTHNGVLIDAVVGTTRCLLLVHQPALLIQLSPRETEIARMVAEGRTNQAIAASLDISVWTVSTHLRRIFAKLAVTSRAEMVAHLLDHREYSTPALRRPK